jgi:hypothetical protein
MIIQFPANTRDQIESMINADGRNVEFFTQTLSGCYYSGCSLDPVTNTSVLSLCPVCSGRYWIPLYSGYEIKAHVTWKFSDYGQFNTGGMTFLGDGIIKVMYSGPYMDVIENTEYAVVDGKEVNIEKVTLLGIPSVNRIVLDFKQKE